jgi:signal transduction histidine kinase
VIDQPVVRRFDVVADPLGRAERRAALRERASALARLSVVIAQAVRDPLIGIREALGPLQREEVAAELRAAAVDIQRQVTRLDRIVSDVLDFARPLRVALAPVDVAALVWEVAGGLFDGWEGPHVRVALAPGTGTIVTDGERVRAVLAKLLENAREGVRAAGRAGAVDSIEIGGRRTAGCRLRLWIEDSGAGVAAADLPYVFEPFFTTRRTGTGLGLAIARKVVEALGGSIWIESRPGEGTRVEIELPDNANLKEGA